MVLLAAIAILGAQATDFPVGTYRIDITKAPKKDRGLLSPYFEGRYLSVSNDGEFELIGNQQRGYWRKADSRYVFVFDGFFTIRSSDPADKLKNAWPKSNLEGWILKPGAGGTLVLNSWGIAKGPIVFRPMPKRSIRQLLLTAYFDGDEISNEANEAWSVLYNRKNKDWREFLDFVNDPSLPWRKRGLAAIMMEGVTNPEGLTACANLILNLKPTDEPPRGDRAIRGSLAAAVSRVPTDQNLDILLSAESKKLIDPWRFAEMIPKLNRVSEIPRLIGWLNYPKKSDQIAAIEALTRLDSTEGFERVKALSQSDEEDLMVASHGYLARLSSVPDERKASMELLFKASKSQNFLTPFRAIDAIISSHQPESIPYLASILLSDQDSLYRAKAAESLGEIGDPRAIPALLEAKGRKGDLENLVQDSIVRRAAVEALVAIEKKQKATEKAG